MTEEYRRQLAFKLHRCVLEHTRRLLFFDNLTEVTTEVGMHPSYKERKKKMEKSIKKEKGKNKEQGDTKHSVHFG